MDKRNALFFIGFALLMVATLTSVVRAADTVTEPSTFMASLVNAGEVFGSWLLYMLLGLLSAVSGKESFDGKKFVYSLLIAVIVCILTIATGLSPTVLWESHGDAISSVLTTLLSTGVFLPLIYMFQKLFDIFSALWKRGQSLWTKPPPG